MYYGSDNQVGASEQVMQMLNTANDGYEHSYGEDKWTAQAVEELKKVFECDLVAFFVATGTAANTLALSCMVQPWEQILCHRHAHIFVDESTAVEQITGGARLMPVSMGSDKITPEHIKSYLQKSGDDIPHNPPAKAISIAQASEAGLVYTPEELKSVCETSKEHGLKVHMDGARFANAVAAIGCTPDELSWKAGIDVLSLGATKCGALCAEAVIFFDKELAENFFHRRKRAGHLVSKGRVFGAQFTGWLQNNHWLDLARHANSQAALLSDELSKFDELRLVWPVQANELFLVMPKDLAAHLTKAGAEFHEWYTDALPDDIQLKKEEEFIRLVTSFASQDDHRKEFCKSIRKYL
jgi:threonine aldolase